MADSPMTATSAALLTTPGLTLPHAQAVLCPGNDLGIQSDGMQLTGWGSNEVQLVSDPITGYGGVLSVFQGYRGTMTLQSDPSLGPQHSYVIGLAQLRKDGAPFEVDWADPHLSSGTEIYNALMYTYGSAQGLYAGPSMNCVAEGACTMERVGGQLIFGIRPLEIALTVASASVEPAASTVVEIDFTVQ
jgi:hypothetical protein